MIIRTQAMLCIMLGTGMRLEEVLCLCPTDVQMMVTGFEQELKKAGVQLFVGKTKTDVCRQGNVKMLTGNSLMRGVAWHLETAGLTDGNKLDAFTAVAPTFRATRRSNKVEVDAHAAHGLPWLARHEAPSQAWETRGKTCAMPSTKTPGEKNVERTRTKSRTRRNDHLMKSINKKNNMINAQQRARSRHP